MIPSDTTTGPAAAPLNDVGWAPADPIVLKGFAVTYDRSFNLGDFETLKAAVTFWVRTTTAAEADFDLHHARERVRRTARENVRAQLLCRQGEKGPVFLALQPPRTGQADPIQIHAARLTLVMQASLGKGNTLTTGYTDWAELTAVADDPGALHIDLQRMWNSLWANAEDELSRARGEGGIDGDLGFHDLPAEKAATAKGTPPLMTRPRNGRTAGGRGRR